MSDAPHGVDAERQAVAEARRGELRARGTGSLAERLWDLDWRTHFPAVVSRDGDVSADIISSQAFLAFAVAHYPVIFKAPNRGLLQLRQHVSRSRFYEQEADLFGFFHGQELVGVCAANATDWSTYYLRSAGILPAYQGQGVWRSFLERLLVILREQTVERVEGDVDPTNEIEVLAFTRFGFLVTGQTISERWGSLVKFTKFLNPACETTFRRQFCSAFSEASPSQSGFWDSEPS